MGVETVPRSKAARAQSRYFARVGESQARRRAAWRFLRAVVRSQSSGGVGAAPAGLLRRDGACSAVMLAIDVKLALVVLIPLPLGSLAAGQYSRRYDARTRLLQQAWADTATLVEESISGIRVVKGLGAGGALAGRFRDRSDRIVRRALAVARLDAG